MGERTVLGYVYLMLLLGAVIALCVFMNRVSDRLKVPSLLFFIALGTAVGVLLRPQIGNFTDYGFGNAVCSVCLVFVIFYGGFGTNFSAAKPVVARAALLSTLGTALTAGIVGVGVYGIFQLLPFGEVGWAESLLVGSVLCSTDAASVFNILRSRKLNLKYRTSSLLEMESGSNDPVSYMLTAVLTAIIAANNGLGEPFGAWQTAAMLCAQLGFGALFGVAFGALGVLLLKRFSSKIRQSETVFLIATALVAYALPTVLPGLWSGNGFLSAYLCGIIIGNARIPKKREAVLFFDTLTDIAQMVIFFLLGLLATPEWLIQPRVLVPALLIFAIITLIARPIAVSALLVPFRAKFGQIAIVSWSGLRGVASVVFAAFAMGQLGDSLPYDLFSIVFLVVLLSVAAQGTLLPVLSEKMHMLSPGDDVLRTFNDYQNESEVSFVKVVVGERHPWANKKLKECILPREFLVVLILRGEQVIVPNGETLVCAGDLLVTAAPEFENNQQFGMYEEFIGKGHPYENRKISEAPLPEGALIAMIKRDGGTVIPYGATVLQQGDTLVCIRLSHQNSNTYA